MVGLLGARFFANQLVGLSVGSSSATLGARQLSWGLHGVWIVRHFIVSHAGDSTAFGFFVQASPAKLGIPWCSDSSCKSRQLSWRLPWQSDLAMSHRCAINLLHAVWIRVLILGSTSGVLMRACRMMSATLSDFFFFDPATRFILHLPAGSGTKWLHFTWR